MKHWEEDLLELKSQFFSLTEHHLIEVLLHAFSTLVLDISVWSATFPQPLYPQGKSLWFPLDRRLGGPQSRSGRCGEEKNPPPPNHPVILEARRKVVDSSQGPLDCDT
jgi:hypothetical protein